MTRNDYVAIAAAIKSAHKDVASFTHGVKADHKESTDLAFAYAVHNLAHVFLADNPRFKPNQFIIACGLGELVGA